ncbi:endonuclease III [bacterium 3DAC]|nr:endonuclease III [bacterium 3DAC]
MPSFFLFNKRILCDILKMNFVCMGGNMGNYAEVLNRLKQSFGATFPFYEGNPYKVLISCILSARSRDERTYLTADRLFEKYPEPCQLAEAKLEDVQDILRHLGLWREKSKRVIDAAKVICELGYVPDTFEELTKIPGIGRKCAHIVLAYGFGKRVVAVDTHVRRISKRLGIVSLDAKDEDIERAWLSVLGDDAKDINHYLVALGRKLCGRTPKCSECPLNDICKKQGV